MSERARIDMPMSTERSAFVQISWIHEPARSLAGGRFPFVAVFGFVGFFVDFSAVSDAFTAAFAIFKCPEPL